MDNSSLILLVGFLFVGPHSFETYEAAGAHKFREGHRQFAGLCFRMTHIIAQLSACGALRLALAKVRDGPRTKLVRRLAARTR